MFATLAVAACLAVVYCVLIARQLLKAKAEHRLRPVDVETAAVRGLLDGTTSQAAYRAAMESAARQAGHLIRVPE
jgi:hypothetical protein